MCSGRDLQNVKSVRTLQDVALVVQFSYSVCLNSRWNNVAVSLWPYRFHAPITKMQK